MGIRTILLLEDLATSSLADRLEKMLSTYRVTRKIIQEPQRRRLLQGEGYYDLALVPATTGLQRGSPDQGRIQSLGQRGNRNCLIVGYGIAPRNGAPYDDFLTTPKLMGANSPEAYLRSFL